MRVKKISAFIMACVLCLSSFTLFSFAADTQSVKDSGSPDVSLMALRSIAADDGISLAAAEGNSGQFGFNILDGIYPDSVSYNPEAWATGSQYRFYFNNLSVGEYSFYVSFDPSAASNLRAGGVSSDGVTIASTSSISGSSLSYDFTLSEPSESLYITANFTPIIESAPSIHSSNLSLLVPVEGISSGYFHSEVFQSSRLRYDIQTVSWDFGNVPAGNYVINVYVDSVFADFDFSIKSGNRYLSFYNLDGVSSSVVSHSGGNLVLDGSYIAYPIYDVSTHTLVGNYSEYSGTGSFSATTVYESDWGYYITDVVAVPLESAGLEQFGVFGAVVGFFRDQFSDMKSFIASQIDKIAGDDPTKSDVENAQSELEKEVEDLNNLSGQLDIQASNLEQQFTTDFAIPDTVAGQGANFQSIYTSLFGSLGVFGIFIWLPIVMAVIKKLLRL